MEYRIPDVRCDVRKEIETQLNGALRTGRWSTFLREQLAFFLQHRIVNVASVIDEIRHLEWRDTDPTAFRSRTKPESRFTDSRLASYWHKHFFDDAFLVTNLLVEHRRRENAVTRMLKDSLGHGFDEEQVKRLVHTSVLTSFADRSGALRTEHNGNSRLTGEWIIFSRENDRNTYLTLGVHKMGDASRDEVNRFHADLCSKAAAEFSGGSKQPK